jgi:hypothetical protein
MVIYDIYALLKFAANMKNQSKNRIDQLIVSLSEELSRIPNFDLTRTDPDTNRLFNLIVIKFADIQDFKILYRRYYIPATQRAIIDTRKELKTSIYVKALSVTDTQLKENYYDTIRLGYVGLFHKVENYIKDILKEVNYLFNEGRSDSESIEKFFEKKYKYNFLNWYSDNEINKINWICNCVKHYDGYPKKEPKFHYLRHLSEDEKIKIEKEDFLKDIDYVTDTFYKLKLSQIFALAVFKMATNDKDENEHLMTDELREKYRTLENKIKEIMN